MDDVIIFSTSLEEHVDSVDKISGKLRESNLKVLLDKTEFLCKETKVLGHIITTDGIKSNPDKIIAIQKYPIPKTKKDIQSFLGITGYYRKFIMDYAKNRKTLSLSAKRWI